MYLIEIHVFCVNVEVCIEFPLEMTSGIYNPPFFLKIFGINVHNHCQAVYVSLRMFCQHVFSLPVVKRNRANACAKIVIFQTGLIGCYNNFFFTYNCLFA